MRVPDRSPVARPPTTGAADGGFTLIEIMVAFTIFAIFSTGVLTVLGAGIKLGNEDSVRLSAANLAARELEATRDVFTSPTRGPSQVPIGQRVNPTPLAGGVVGAPLVVDNVPFTVTRTAQWASLDGTGASTCDDTTATELGYLKVRVDVTWPDLGSRSPITMYTTLTPRKGTYSTGASHISLKVVDRAGLGRSGVTVQIAGPTPRSALTDADGCVLLTYLTPGTYSLTLSSSGSVDPPGDPAATQSVLLGTAQLWRGTVSYDRAARINATFTTASLHAVPTGLAAIPVSVANSALSTGSRPITGTGTTRALTNLYPFTSGYQLYSGRCPDNDPAWPGNGSANSTDPVRVEAETGTALSPTFVSTNAAGFSDSGFVEGFTATGARLENIRLDRATAGSTTLTIRYSTEKVPGSKDRLLTMAINGAPPTTLAFAQSNGTSSWRTLTLTVTLRVGTNFIDFVQPGDNTAGGVALDYLETTPAPAPPSPVGAREPVITTQPGGTASGTVRLAPLEVTGAAGLAVKARQDNCPGSPTIDVGTVPAGGTLRTSLPFGTWQVYATSPATRSTVLLQAPTTGGTVATPSVGVR